jgi:hypothetical protein
LPFDLGIFKKLSITEVFIGRTRIHMSQMKEMKIHKWMDGNLEEVSDKIAEG